VKQGARQQRVAWRNLSERLRRVRPAQLLKQRHELLKAARRRLDELAKINLQNGKGRFSALESRLRLLGPEQVLARGYSITLDAATDRVLRDAKDVKPGQLLKTRLKKGEVSSRAEK
jgi:exodeoxyribonuclease VII large subunit